MLQLTREKIKQLKEFAVKQQADAKAAIQKANNYVKEKKLEWARIVQEKTLKRMALHEFPPNFSAQTLKMHKSNEKMYPMLERVEQAIVKNVKENMGHVG